MVRPCSRKRWSQRFHRKCSRETRPPLLSSIARITNFRARSSKPGEFRKNNSPPAKANSTTPRMPAITRKMRLLKNLNPAPPFDGFQPDIHLVIHLFGSDAALKHGGHFRGLHRRVE